MSKISALIQELQVKQKKIDYLLYIKDLLKGDQKCLDYIEVQEEVLSKLTPVIDKLAKDIEDGVDSSQNDTTDFSKDQIKVLTILADKAKSVLENNIGGSTGTATNKSSADTLTVQTPKKPVMSNPDKMSFAMDNRHLANKDITVIAKDGKSIPGRVVGLDAPYVVVKTDAGPTINVPLENIQQP